MEGRGIERRQPEASATVPLAEVAKVTQSPETSPQTFHTLPQSLLFHLCTLTPCTLHSFPYTSSQVPVPEPGRGHSENLSTEQKSTFRRRRRCGTVSSTCMFYLSSIHTCKAGIRVIISHAETEAQKGSVICFRSNNS